MIKIHQIYIFIIHESTSHHQPSWLHCYPFLHHIDEQAWLGSSFLIILSFRGLLNSLDCFFTHTESDHPPPKSIKDYAALLRMDRLYLVRRRRIPLNDLVKEERKYKNNIKKPISTRALTKHDWSAAYGMKCTVHVYVGT